jgi:hypothetical protein
MSPGVFNAAFVHLSHPVLDLGFNALGLGGLSDRKAPGRPSLPNDEHRKALAAAIASGPTPAPTASCAAG